MSLRFAAAFLAVCFVMVAPARADIFVADLDNNNGVFVYSAGGVGGGGASEVVSGTYTVQNLTLGTGENFDMSFDIEVLGGSGFLNGSSDNLGVASAGQSTIDNNRITSGESIRISNVQFANVSGGTGAVGFVSFREIGFEAMTADDQGRFVVGGSNSDWDDLTDGDPNQLLLNNGAGGAGTVPAFDLRAAHGSDVNQFDLVHIAGSYSLSSISIEVVAVPEPSSLIALSLLGGVAFVGRRRK